MGMFDTVYTKCTCGNRVEFQSKAGDCNLDTYEASEVPIVIAAALDGEMESCDRCGNVLTLRYPKTSPMHIAMRVEQ